MGLMDSDAGQIGLLAGSQLASGMLNFGASIYANNNNEFSSTLTNMTNAMLAREQNKWNEYMYYYNNAYNSPAQQAKRLKGLGLSDAAIAQSVGNVQSQAPQSAELANQQQRIPATPLDFSALNVIGTLRQIYALYKEKAEAKQEKIKADLTTPTILTDLDAKNWAIKLAQQSFEYQARANPFHLRGLEMSTKAASWLPKVAKVGYMQAKVNLDLARQTFGWTEKLNDASWKKMQAEISNIQSDTAKNYAEVGNIAADTDNKRAMHKGILAQSDIAELDKILKSYGSPETTTQRIATLAASGKLSLTQVMAILHQGREYLESAGHVFNGSLEEKNFFSFIINEGQSQFLKQGFHTMSMPYGVYNAGRGYAGRSYYTNGRPAGR